MLHVETQKEKDSHKNLQYMEVHDIISYLPLETLPSKLAEIIYSLFRNL